MAYTPKRYFPEGYFAPDFFGSGVSQPPEPQHVADPVRMVRTMLRQHLRDIVAIELVGHVVEVTVEYRRSNARVNERIAFAHGILKEHLGVGVVAKPVKEEYNAADMSFGRAHVPVHWSVETVVGWPGRK